MIYTLHYADNISESIRTNVDADSIDEAVEIVKRVGWKVVNTNEDMHMIIVAND